MGQQVADVAQVGLDDGAVRVVRQQQAAVRDGDRVAVHVDDLRLGADRPGDLVHGAEGRDAGADVQEAGHAPLGEEGHGAAQEGAVGAHDLRQLRPQADRLAGHLPVDLEVVRTPEVVVVDPRGVRFVQVRPLRYPARSPHACDSFTPDPGAQRPGDAAVTDETTSTEDPPPHPERVQAE